MIERPDELRSTTYKIRSPIIDEAVYITISDMEVEGVVRPVEVFINCKHMDSFQWITCVTRLLSGALRNEGEFPCWVIKEIMDTYDPKGGYIIPKSGGQSVGGVVSHIGLVFREHCRKLGLLDSASDLKGEGK